MNDLAIIIAAPAASGKTTYVANLVSRRPGFKVISPDDLRAELTGDASDQSKNAFIFNTLLPIHINGAHSSMRNLIVDATNTTRKARRQVIDYARTAGYTRIECHVLRVPIEVCKRRNAARARVVPDFVIDRQFAQWQEPELTEGLDAVIQVGHPHTYPIDTLVKLKPLTARSLTAWTRNLDPDKVYKVNARYYERIGLEGMSLDDSWEAAIFDAIGLDSAAQVGETAVI